MKSPKTPTILTKGVGLPFYVPERYPLEQNDAERQMPIVIDLSDLNGDYGMPKNFTDKRGRILPSYERYWSPDEFAVAVNGSRDIE